MLLGDRTSMAVRRGWSRAVAQIVRDRTWGQTVLLLSAVLLMVQLLCMLLLSARAAGDVLAAQAGIRIEVADTAPDQAVQEMYAALRAQPFVERVAFVSAEQAYELQRARDPDLINFLETYGLDNPFPDTFSVTLQSFSAYDTLMRFVQQDQWRGVLSTSFVSSAGQQESSIRDVLHAVQGVQSMVAILLVMALVVLCFVMLEWVMRATMRRRRTIVLEQVLGGSPLAIALPFVWEMTLLLAAGLLAGTAVTVGMLVMLPRFMPALMAEGMFRTFHAAVLTQMSSVFPWVVAAECVLLPVAALGGVWLGMRRMRTPRADGLLC